MAQLVLVHRKSGTVFNINYSKGTENLAVTGIHLGKLDTDQPKHVKVILQPCCRCSCSLSGQAGANAQLIYSAAVAALVYQKGVAASNELALNDDKGPTFTG